MKTVKVFSEKLGADISIELDGNAVGITSWDSWVNEGWNNWGAICN